VGVEAALGELVVAAVDDHQIGRVRHDLAHGAEHPPAAVAGDRRVHHLDGRVRQLRGEPLREPRGERVAGAVRHAGRGGLADDEDAERARRLRGEEVA
jgi:hypothetical protein